MDFRLKRIPDPTPYLAGRVEGRINLELLMASPIIPKMANFDFDLNFRITEYSLNIYRADSMIFQELHSPGNILSWKSKAALSKCVNDDKVLIYNVNCIGPDKFVRILKDSLLFLIDGPKDPKPDLVFDDSITKILLVSNTEQLHEIPSSIFKLHHLRALEIRGSDCDTPYLGCYQIYEISSEIGNLHELEKFSLPYQQIKVVPSELANLKKLKSINLSGNYGLKDIDVFTIMPWLEEIILYDCKLDVLPADIGNLKKLKLLDIRYTRIPEVEYQRIKKALPKCEIKYNK
jgi:Leucine-rich repeat (LRR) protein